VAEHPADSGKPQICPPLQSVLVTQALPPASAPEPPLDPVVPLDPEAPLDPEDPEPPLDPGPLLDPELDEPLLAP